MIKVTNIAAVAALLSFPAITLAFDNNGSDVTAATAAANAVASEASQTQEIEMRRALWKSYTADVDADQMINTYAADYSASGSVEEVRTIYVVGKGMALTK